MGKKRGVSPVVATVLLVAIVIVIALIIFLWFKELKGETCTKFDQNIELSCGNVEFLGDYNNGELYISNTGNVPIFGMKVKVIGIASHKTFDLNDSFGWPALGLNQGEAFSGDIISKITSDTNSIVLIPTLMGSCGNEGDKVYMCNEANNGFEINIG